MSWQPYLASDNTRRPPDLSGEAGKFRGRRTCTRTKWPAIWRPPTGRRLMCEIRSMENVKNRVSCLVAQVGFRAPVLLLRWDQAVVSHFEEQTPAMIPLLAAILLAGAAGAGPVLVSDACGSDTTTNDDLARGRCAVETVSRNMKAKERPAELKVEAEGKLYSVPEGVEMLTPPPQGELDQWWKEFFRKFREFCSGGANKAKVVGSDSARPSGDAAGDQGNSSQSDSDNGGDDDGTVQGEAAVANKDVRSAGEHSCQICFDQDHSTVMLPCGHGGLCWDCGLQIYALTEECPMCRTKIELLVQLDGEKRRYEGEDEYVSALCA